MLSLSETDLRNATNLLRGFDRLRNLPSRLLINLNTSNESGRKLTIVIILLLLLLLPTTSQFEFEGKLELEEKSLSLFEDFSSLLSLFESIY